MPAAYTKDTQDSIDSAKDTKDTMDTEDTMFLAMRHGMPNDTM